MTGADLKNIFLSAGYKEDLQELSSYLASIKQERPMVYCLAKHMWKLGYRFQLEAKLKDVFVDGKRIEFKFNYDRDMERLEHELRRYMGKPLKEIRAALQANNKSIGWSVGLKIYEDFCEKKPDLFVLIICSRDLRKVAADDIERICVSEAQRNWSAKHLYEERGYLAITDGFLEQLRVLRPCSILKAEIMTNGDFPSTYHFRICEFGC